VGGWDAAEAVGVGGGGANDEGLCVIAVEWVVAREGEGGGISCAQEEGRAERVFEGEDHDGLG
jgi:hypothetical protein